MSIPFDTRCDDMPHPVAPCPVTGRGGKCPAFFIFARRDLSRCQARSVRRDLSGAICQAIARPRAPVTAPARTGPLAENRIAFNLRSPTSDPLLRPPPRAHTRILRFCTYDYHFVKYPKTGPYWKRASLHRPPFSYKRGRESQYPPIL